MANLQSQIDILAKAVVKEYINLENYKVNNKGSVTLTEVNRNAKVYNNVGNEITNVNGGGGGQEIIDYKEESYKLEVSKDDKVSTTMFVYDENHNFSGFWFYNDNNSSSYMVNDKGEIISSSNSESFNLESSTFVRRIDLNKGEIGKTQNDKNNERIVYIGEKATVDGVSLIYDKNTLEIIKSSDTNWNGKYYVEFTDSEKNDIRLIIEIDMEKNIANIISNNDFGYSVHPVQEEITEETTTEETDNSKVNFDIKKGNDIIYAYRSKDIKDKEFANKNDNGNMTYMNNTTLLGVHLAPGIKEIGENAFYKCINLTGVTIPNSVEFIGSSAFEGCSSLTQITIPNNVTIICGGTFRNCSSLTQVTIPNSVITINHDVFRNCSSLTQVTIPNSVTSISSSVFQGCSLLKEVTIPNSVTRIFVYTFADCIRLTRVEIPDNVEAIGEYAFNGCSNLTQVTIPNSVEFIGSSVFQGCSNLTQVTIPNSVTSINTDAFYGCNNINTITITNHNNVVNDNDSNGINDQIESALNINNYTKGDEINNTITYTKK